jgi:ribosomal protein S18 acetylase RimI-like enzyme
MHSDITIEIVDTIHLQKIRRFLRNIGNSAETFRYFTNRPLSVIKNHIITLLALTEEKEPVGYGHLDKERDRVWLGICVAELSRGQGIGKKLMQRLLVEADRKQIPNIYLSVDQNNTFAIQLYRNYGFSESEKKGDVCIFHRTFSKN